MKNFTVLIVIMILSFGCRETINTLSMVDINEMKRVTSEISSDEFAGRMPFTDGEKLSVEYLAKELEKIGFEPAFGDSYFQMVPMVMITSSVKGDVQFKVNGKTIQLKAPDQIAINSPQTLERVLINSSKLVFAGFGIDSDEW